MKVTIGLDFKHPLSKGIEIKTKTIFFKSYRNRKNDHIPIRNSQSKFEATIREEAFQWGESHVSITWDSHVMPLYYYD